jgi:hypothetical protein
VYRRPLLVLAMACALAGGCSVGQGVGAAKGAIFDYGCSKETGDYCAEGMCGTAEVFAPYDLKPTYFTGEPINDLRQQYAGSAIMLNRLIIRLQRSGKQIDFNDVLTFDVMNSYEVARCVRGRIDEATGAKDWDTANCYRDPSSDTGPGRVRIQYDGAISASLMLRSTCPIKETQDLPSAATHVATAIAEPVPIYPQTYGTTARPAVTDGNWLSWVEFQEFGSASQADRPATQRDPVGPKFLVDFGQRIYAATFRLTLTDSILVEAALNDLPSPNGQVGGLLGGDPTTGRFDFDLQRGRGGQTFP